MNMKTAVAKAKTVRTTTRKLNIVLDQIRGLEIANAILQLKFSKKGIATEVLKVLNSAISNAENNLNMDIDRLYISSAYSGKSITMKRFRARARGRASRIKKSFSNMTIELLEKRGA